MPLSSSLTTRQANDHIAFVSKRLPTLNGFQGFIQTEQFLSHVIALAEQLPNKKHIINLCANRYLFLVSLCAALLKEQINLLPPNKNLATQEKLADRYGDAYVLHDGIDVHEKLRSFNLAEIYLSDKKISFSSNENGLVQQIPFNQIALISFTSGSTGDSKPNIKTWQTLTASTKINRQYMLPDPDENYNILATVPGQHMWGLETSVLMALFTPACIVDSKPLFPADIQDALECIPAPRVIVTTPVHLRALVNSQQLFPEVDYILCATSPLTKDLAKQAEQKFKGQLHEVYGCSEIGSMALRKTASENDWLKFSGINFQNQGDQTLASTEYLPDPVRLGDQVKLFKNSRFELLGRSEDLVNIAGKRGSLAEINSILFQFEGLVDGVVIFPEQDNPDQTVARLAAIVSLKSESYELSLKKHFRKHLDDVFVPRRIFVVDSLPRQDNGKLPRKEIEELYQKLIN